MFALRHECQAESFFSELAQHGDDLYLDANATSPEHARALGELVTIGGATFTDGSVIGPPPRVAGTSRLYLSGPDADFLAAFV